MVPLLQAWQLESCYEPRAVPAEKSNILYWSSQTYILTMKCYPTEWIKVLLFSHIIQLLATVVGTHLFIHLKLSEIF